MKQEFKIIAVSPENYKALKKLGEAGDSFNDVVTEMIRKLKNKENSTVVGATN